MYQSMQNMAVLSTTRLTHSVDRTHVDQATF